MRILIIALTILVLTLTACGLFDTVEAPSFTVISGSGNVTTETRPVQNFDRVVFADDGMLILTQNGTEGLQIEADDNVLPVIETTVENGTLTIKLQEMTDLRTASPIRYTLSVDNLDELEMLGDGRITVNDLQSDTFTLKMNGDGTLSADSITTAAGLSVALTGDGDITVHQLNAQALSTTVKGDGRITVAGEAANHTILINGNGQVAADDLQSDSASINVNGDGKVSVWVMDTMNVDASGDAVVSYQGSPQIQQNVRGDASLVSASE